MTRVEFLERFPNASESTIRANCAAARTPITLTEVDDLCAPPSPQPQPCAVPPLAGRSGLKARHSGKRLVRFESRRTRLLDPDNEIFKWHTDALRYAGIIPDDTEADIEIAHSQVKVATKAEEGVLITIEEIV